jgi:hypothetical protein
MSEQLLLDLHNAATNNKAQLLVDGGGMCGCCLRENAYHSLSWYDSTGVCLHCGTDCIIPLSLAHTMSQEQKEAFQDHWFEGLR